MPEIIERKRDGLETSPEELAELLRGLLDGSVPSYQVAAWLMAVVFRGMSERETASLTRLMMESGEVLDLSDLPGIKVDKHSTGGVGDKISIPLAPAAAAAGVTVPMISGRGLGHTGGTLDKLESIPGLRTNLGPPEFRRVVGDVGFSIVGAGSSLAPADRELYALRDVTGTVPSIPLITASILSKKYAAGVQGLVLDVKAGSGAFLRERAQAEELARVLVAVSSEMEKKAVALVTSMDQPLGRAVGNALEIAESIDVLRGEGPEDVRELVLVLGAEMLLLAGVRADRETAREALAKAIASGAALDRFRRFVAAQGGDERVCDDAGRLPQAPIQVEVRVARTGWIGALDTREIGLAANELGAGRARVGDPVDPAVGFVFRAKLGDAVDGGDSWATVHARTQDAADRAAARLERAVRIDDAAPELRPLVLSGPGT
ncbi:MAG: thymidine phosphorylase [Candidatus Eiseniibacteriota bacterium]